MRASICLSSVLFLSMPVAAAGPREPQPGAGEPGDITELDLAELGEVKIEIATGTPRPLAEAPAVASVITAEQIEEMGARTLSEVLESVAGLHVVPSQSRRLDPVYVIRGVLSSSAAQVLILRNGVPITQAFSGGPALNFHLPVADVERIEVIRGPGSAVYGADAFAGVINVLTKGAGDLDGLEVGARAGSFDFRDAWLQYGGVVGGWELAASFQWQESTGDRDRIIGTDGQAPLDARFGTAASLAPGPLETRYQVLTGNLELTRDPWTFRVWSWRNEDRGTGAGGGNQVLDPAGRSDTHELLAELLWEETGLLAGWELSSRVSYHLIDQDSELVLFPPGAVLPIDVIGNVSSGDESRDVLFPDGAIGTPGFDDTTAALEAVALFVGSERHRVRLAAGLVHQVVNDTRASQNFGAGAIEPGVTVRDGDLTDLTGTPFIFMMDQSRDLWYLSLQDEWSLAARWRLTAGLRYDRYSDFGGTLNPRLALVWTARDDLFVKVLYGSAFRAPSFAEQFTINNPSLLGNPNLDPEEISTVELAFDYRPRPGLRLALNLFTLGVDGLIDQLPTADAAGRMAQNAVERKGYGYEVELEWHPAEQFQLHGNFAWQQSEDEKNGHPVADVPGWQLYLDALFRFAPDWSLDLRLNRIANRVRGRDDTRDPIGDYTLVDLTLRRKRILDFWDAAVGVRNLFDEDAREPSDGIIPGDYPLESRSAFVELRYRF